MATLFDHMQSLPSVKAEKKTDLGRLVAGHEDTVNGEKVNTSSMAFGFDGGTATVNHDGKEKVINICSMGPSLALSHKGRTFFFDIQRLIRHAIDNGLLADTIDFKAESE